jgi:exopolyphosphatase / guanosine-5'-triphosphate,3'-diphosphate pyrophosphatase
MAQPHRSPPALAAIDIGTNSIRLLVARPATDRPGFATLEERTVTARLGHGVERTGRLDPDRLEYAVEAVRQFKEIAESHGAVTILVAATSAVREAANGQIFSDYIARSTGLDVEIIDGAREAELTYAGATLGHTLVGTVLVGDLGGGSLELIVAEDGKVLQAQSLKLGSGRLAERHFRSDPPDRTMIAAVEQDALALLDPMAGSIPPIDHMLMVGGTATSLPILAPKPDGNLTLTLRRLYGAVALLTSAPAAALAAETGLDPERVRTLPAGAAIIGALLSSFGVGNAEVSYGGLREGLLLEYLLDQLRRLRTKG